MITELTSPKPGDVWKYSIFLLHLSKQADCKYTLANRKSLMFS